MRRAGHVVSKAELLEHCWDPAVVEVQIHRLRRKIEVPTRAPLITTVRGEGYLITKAAP